MPCFAVPLTVLLSMILLHHSWYAIHFVLMGILLSLLCQLISRQWIMCNHKIFSVKNATKGHFFISCLWCTQRLPVYGIMGRGKEHGWHFAHLWCWRKVVLLGRCSPIHYSTQRILGTEPDSNLLKYIIHWPGKYHFRAGQIITYSNIFSCIRRNLCMMSPRVLGWLVLLTWLLVPTNRVIISNGHWLWRWHPVY